MSTQFFKDKPDGELVGVRFHGGEKRGCCFEWDVSTEELSSCDKVFDCRGYEMTPLQFAFSPLGILNVQTHIFKKGSDDEKYGYFPG